MHDDFDFFTDFVPFMSISRLLRYEIHKFYLRWKSVSQLNGFHNEKRNIEKVISCIDIAFFSGLHTANYCDCAVKCSVMHFLRKRELNMTQNMFLIEKRLHYCWLKESIICCQLIVKNWSFYKLLSTHFWFVISINSN